MIFILKTMPSIKLLKKEINNDIGDFIEEIYLWELSNPNGDLAKSEKLIDEAIQTFDDLMVKINACLLYTSPSPRDRTRSRMPSSA